MFPSDFSHITAEALIPEHLPHYVEKISERKCILLENLPVYIHGSNALVVAYEPKTLRGYLKKPLVADTCSLPFPEEHIREEQKRLLIVKSALREKLGPDASITLLAPFTLSENIGLSKGIEDCYWEISLPLSPPAGKLKNMLTRAAREIRTKMEEWSDECAELVQYYLRTRPLSRGTRILFERLAAYASPSKNTGVRLAAARDKNTGKLVAFSIGDFSGLHTAFYMFAFRYPDAPPGTADLLLHDLMVFAQERGQIRINLGLGISPGIAFFKKKWGARPFLPYVESTGRIGRKTHAKTGAFDKIRTLFRKSP